MDAPTPPDPPKPRPSKGVFRGKRSVNKRSLSRNQKKGSKNQKQDSSQNPASASQPLPSNPSSTTIVKKTTKDEYIAMLQSCRAELDAASREITKKDLLIAKLNKQIKQLTDATKSARETAREAKKQARAVEKEAVVVAKKLKAEVADAQDHLQQSTMDWEHATNAKVEAVRAVEQVSLQTLYHPNAITTLLITILILLSQDRRQRAVTVIEKMMTSKLKSKEREYQSMLRVKDSELKVSLFDIVE